MHGIDSWQQSHWQKHRVLPHTGPNTHKSYSIPEMTGNSFAQYIYSTLTWCGHTKCWVCGKLTEMGETLNSVAVLFIFFDDKPFKNLLLYFTDLPNASLSLWKTFVSFCWKQFLDLIHKPAIFTVWKVRWSLICLSGSSSNTSGWERKRGLFVYFLYCRGLSVPCIQTFYNYIFQN